MHEFTQNGVVYRKSEEDTPIDKLLAPFGEASDECEVVFTSSHPALAGLKLVAETFWPLDKAQALLHSFIRENLDRLAPTSIERITKYLEKTSFEQVLEDGYRPIILVEHDGEDCDGESWSFVVEKDDYGVHVDLALGEIIDVWAGD